MLLWLHILPLSVITTWHSGGNLANTISANVVSKFKGNNFQSRTNLLTFSNRTLAFTTTLHLALSLSTEKSF